MVAQGTGAACDRGGIEDFEAGWMEKLTGEQYKEALVVLRNLMIHADTNNFIKFGIRS